MRVDSSAAVAVMEEGRCAVGLAVATVACGDAITRATATKTSAAAAEATDGVGEPRFSISIVEPPS